MLRICLLYCVSSSCSSFFDCYESQVRTSSESLTSREHARCWSSFHATGAVIVVGDLTEVCVSNHTAELLHLLGRVEEVVVAAANAQVVRLVNLLGTIFVFAHWNGCIQFIVASFDTTVDPQSGLLVVDREAWIVRAGIEHEPPAVQWAWSFYHAMTQLLAISVARCS